MKRLAAVVCAAAAAFGVHLKAAQAEDKPFRPPAVPIVTFNPYLSIWSDADKLTDDVTRHWTHHPHPLVSLIRVDGKSYRLMGNDPSGVPALPQTSLTVLPTRSIYTFANENVKVTLTFMTAALPDDLEVYARPLSYITWDVSSADGKNHAVQVYDSVSGLLTVNRPNETVSWSRATAGDLTALRIGTEDQPILGSAGDDHRIDWGYAYLAADTRQGSSEIGGDATLLEQFDHDGKLTGQDDTHMPRPAEEAKDKGADPVMAVSFDLGEVGQQPVSRHAIVAYDEIQAIKYYGHPLKPYWARKNSDPLAMLKSADADYAQLVDKCTRFDQELVTDLTKVGGARYAQIAALAYRQCAAGCGLVADPHGQPLLLTKENTSNGDIGTVDVIFPMDPIWVALSPTLAKASLAADFVYAESSHWKFDNAPHDLGTYPLIRGTDDGGEGMPVEESGNMLILVDAIAHATGDAKFCDPWWPKLTQWAHYLEQYGLDPEDQLCTDDFMGHLAHNANLSVKAIVALAAYGDLAKMRGEPEVAAKYMKLAKDDAAHWVKVADDGDHYRLAFDKPNTWSQKYNLVWDHLLGLNVFPAEVAQKEIAFYKKAMLQYGVPLDSRTHDTKTDWCCWSATLAQDQQDFEAIVSPIYDYLNSTGARAALADEYHVDKVDSIGMHARPVIGGVFIKLLSDEELWKKWASRDKAQAGNWAPYPKPPVITELVPTGRTASVTWRYTTTKPPQGWTKPDFDDSQWKQGEAGFGTQGTPNAVVKTRWSTDDIWIRREFTVPDDVAQLAQSDPQALQFLIYHDEDVEVYINGVPATREPGYNGNYYPLPIRHTAMEQLKAGAKITLAAHCHQTKGGQDIDIGIAKVTLPEGD